MKYPLFSRYASKKYIVSYMIILFLIFLLKEPSVAIEGARFGLLLWAEHLLPSLLPFLILTQLLIRSGYLDAMMNKLHISYPYFVLLAGTLFGFPMGAKLTVDLYAEGNLSEKEASLLFILANQMSPAFVGGYILTETLHMPALIPATYLILYGPSVCYALLQLHRLHNHSETGSLRFKHKKSASGLQMDLAVLDAGMMNSFEIMLKLGGYIMLFSILSSLCKHVLIEFPAFCTFLTGILEITGAVRMINDYFSNAYVTYVAILAATAFGGCSGIAQTASIIRTGQKGTDLSMSHYIRGRILVAAVTALCAALLYPFIT